MDDLGSKIDLPEEPPPRDFPWTWVVAGLAIFAMGIIAIWLLHSKSGQQSREAVAIQMDKELKADEIALADQKEKVAELSQRVDKMQSAIRDGQAPDAKTAIAEYNQLARQQKSERDK